jgi:glycosyltransferase involved in cell wall biosynthesis
LFFTDLPHGHLLDFFGRAKLFVLPARREGFGLVLLEAGMFDVPIVATDVGGIPEVVTQGETAVLVPPDDPARLADAMLDVLRHPEAARAMAERHRRAVEGKFSWETAYRAYTAPAASRLGW